MTAHAKATLVRRDRLPAPVERKLRVFTQQCDRIEPDEHHLLSAEIEPKVGGHIYGRGVDGTDREEVREDVDSEGG